MATKGIRQQEKGVHILDVNVGFPGVDEVKMLPCKADNVLDFMAICGSNAEVIERLQ